MLSEKDTKQIYQILHAICVYVGSECFIALIALQDFKLQKYPHPPPTLMLLISPAFPGIQSLLFFCFCFLRHQHQQIMS